MVASFIDFNLRIIPDGATLPAMAVGAIAIGAGGLTQGTGFLRLTPEVTTTNAGNTLFVFALPD